MSSEEEQSVVTYEEEEVSGDESEEEVEEEVVIAAPKAKRSRKTKNGKDKKDPNKPKRNLSSFFLFSKANRAILKKENPDLSFGDLTKLVSKTFKELDDDDKEIWDKKAAEDKVRYLEEMKNYEAPESDDSDTNDSDGGNKKRKKKKAKKTKDPNKPKRNMSLYLLFSCANRADIKAKNPDATFGELTKIIAQEYKALSDKEKKKWEKKASKDKVRYLQEMKAYNENN